jgi:hypothetical protein
MHLELAAREHRFMLDGGHGSTAAWHGDVAVVPSHDGARGGALELHDLEAVLNLGFTGRGAMEASSGRMHGGAAACISTVRPRFASSEL